MPVYQSAEIDSCVKIDGCHALLLTGLVASGKPVNILELGFGTGEATRAILLGLNFNIQPFSYRVVDNWLDFQGVPPEETQNPHYSNIDFITQTEQDFVFSCDETFDFIFSDADHLNTQDWFEHVYDNVLAEGGILIYHDVTNTELFPNLLHIYETVKKRNIRHALFNKNSRDGERCDRGLLVIFKDE